MAESGRLLADGRATAWDVTSRVSRSRPWDRFSNGARISALGETFAHLVHLAAVGEAECDGGAPAHWNVGGP